MNRKPSRLSLLLGLAGVFWAGCNNHGPLPPSGPYLIVSEEALDFGTAGFEGLLSLHNGGDADVQWMMDDWPAWISPSPISGNLAPNASASIQILLDRDILDAGAYEDSLVISSNGGDQTIMLFAQQEANPVLGDMPDTLDFGSADDSLQLTIRNAGGDTLDWTITLSDPYFSAAPTSGTTDDEDTVWVHFDRENAPSGYHQATLTISGGGDSQSVHLTAYTTSGSGVWISYSAEGDGYYLTQYTDYYFMVRFDRPTGWQDFKVSKVRLQLYTISGAYDDVQLHCWDVVLDNGYLYPDLGDLRYQSAPLDPAPGWNEWTVDWSLDLSSFCVGYLQLDISGAIYPRPYYDNSSPSARSYATYYSFSYGGYLVDILSQWDWCMEVFVEPLPAVSGSSPAGRWLAPKEIVPRPIESSDRPAALARKVLTFDQVGAIPPLAEK